MRLLIITQKVDSADPILGFFYYWLCEFSRYAEYVTVVCLEEGAHKLPENVKVLSLGKEKKVSRISYLFSFYTYIWTERSNYDAVFVHMNPEYVVLGGILWHLLKKRIGLWYVHRSLDLKLRVAEKCAQVIWSTTPEAFRLPSNKVHFVGHGVNFHLFPKKEHRLESLACDFSILHVGRITPIKNLDILIEAARILKKQWGRSFCIKILGPATTSLEVAYKKKLETLVERYGLEKEILFLGTVPFPNVQVYYSEADVSVNLTPTGGMDKAVLESIASGTIPLSANKAFKDLFGQYADVLLYNERDAEDTARKIMAVGEMELSRKREIEDYLYAKVQKSFSLHALIQRIVQDLTTV